MHYHVLKFYYYLKKELEQKKIKKLDNEYWSTKNFYNLRQVRM